VSAYEKPRIYLCNVSPCRVSTSGCMPASSGRRLFVTYAHATRIHTGGPVAGQRRVLITTSSGRNWQHQSLTGLHSSFTTTATRSVTVTRVDGPSNVEHEALIDERRELVSEYEIPLSGRQPETIYRCWSDRDDR
jgi:hypothetical protein